MNISRLGRNICTAKRICRTYKDALTYLLLLYGRDWSFNDRLNSVDHEMRFCFPEMPDLCLKLRNNLGSDMFVFSEVFIHEYYRIPLTQKPQYVLDLGANIGLTSLYFHFLYPECKLAAVEPIAGNIELLRWNLSANSVAASVFEGAIAVDDGKVQMIISDRDFNHRIGDNESADTLTVKAYSIASLMDTLGWPRIDLLKIDIEGYESRLLRQNTEWLKNVRNLLLELHDDRDIPLLGVLANRYKFSNPRQVNGLWLLSRE